MAFCSLYSTRLSVSSSCLWCPMCSKCSPCCEDGAELVMTRWSHGDGANEAQNANSSLAVVVSLSLSIPSFHKTHHPRVRERLRSFALAVLAVLTVRESGRIGRRQKLKIGTCAASRQAKCADADGADGVRKQLSVRSSVGLEKLNKNFCQTRRSLVLRHRRLWK